MFNALLDYTSSVEPVYDDRSTAMIVMIVVICILVTTLIVFIGIFLSRRQDEANEHKKPTSNTSPTEEQKIIEKYHRLNDNDKSVINQMINSLNNKSDKG